MIKNILEQSQTFLKEKELTNFFYGKNENIIYVKVRDSSRFYNKKGELKVEKLEDEKCKVKVVLQIEGLTLGKNNNLQVSVYDAIIKEDIYEYERLVPDFSDDDDE